MPWARFADDYLGNPKLASLSTAAIALDMASIIYSARDLRDGHLTDHDVRVIAALLHLRRWEPATDELVVVHRWVVEPGGWEIHDYLDYQPSRAKVLAERTAARDRRRIRSPDSGLRSDYVLPDSTRNSEDVRPESGRTQSTPYPVPVPVPEFPTEIPGAPPNPPRKRRGRRSSRANGLEFNEDGPRYEQRTGSDGKREWVEVSA